MDNFKAVYMILSALEKAMDLPDFDIHDIGPKQLEVSEERWMRYLEMMTDVGYIKGPRFQKNVLGKTEMIAFDVRITLKGLEYLQENSIMQRVYKTAKGIVDLVP